MPLGVNKAALFGMGGISGEDIELISTTTLSGNSEFAFTGFSSDYKSLMWQFVGMNGSAHDSDLVFRCRESGEDYGIYTTTSAFRVVNPNSGSGALQYQPAADAAHSDQEIIFGYNLDDGSEAANTANSGVFQLFNPTSGIFIKQFSTQIDGGFATSGGGAQNFSTGGYINTTTALEAIEFKWDDPTGTMDAGKILYWGIK